MSLTEHVTQHTTAALEHLTTVSEMLKSPEPGLAMWWLAVGNHLNSARDEIDAALIAPRGEEEK